LNTRRQELTWVQNPVSLYGSGTGVVVSLTLVHHTAEVMCNA